MFQLKSFLAPAALLVSGLLLGSCGGNSAGDTHTNTPTSTLGTDSAAAKVGGMPTDTAATKALPTGANPGAPGAGPR